MAINSKIICGGKLDINPKIMNNMIVTEISPISEFDVENVLKIIFDFNKDVIFHTYEYSRENQTVYLYSDKDINLKYYERFRRNRPLAQTSEILMEIRNVLSNTKTNDLESASLYDIFNVISDKRKSYEKIKRSFNNTFEFILKSRYKRTCAVTIYDFDYINNQLKLTFDSCINSDWNRSEYMCFSKDNGKIYLASEKTTNSDIILLLLGNHLSKLYDDFMSYKKFMTENLYSISSDSKFVINITKNGIDVSTTTLRNRFNFDFCLSLSSYNGECRCDCNSVYFLKILNGKYKEFFERISVKIEDCPKYLQKELYEIRKQQLSEKSFLLSLKEKGYNLTKQVIMLKEKIK